MFFDNVVLTMYLYFYFGMNIGLIIIGFDIIWNELEFEPRNWRDIKIGLLIFHIIFLPGTIVWLIIYFIAIQLVKVGELKIWKIRPFKAE